MLKTKAILRKLTIAGLAAMVFLSITVFLTGCFRKTDGSSIMTTKKGFKAESFLPSSTLVMFKIGADDKNQSDNFKKLVALFAGNEDTFYNVFEQSFNDNMKDAGISFVTDILGTFGENPRGVVALFTKDGALDDNTQQGDTEESQISVDDIKQFGAVVAVEDTQSLNLLLQKLTSKLQYTTTQYNGVQIYTKADESLAPDGDALLVASDVEVLKRMIDTHANPQNSLLVQDDYQNSIKNLQSNVAFLYIKTKDFLKFLNKLNQQLVANGQSKSQMVLKEDYLNLFAVQTATFTAENDGISIKSNIFSEQNTDGKNAFKFSDFPKHAAYLYKKIGGNDSIFFTEGYNLAKSFEMQASMYEFDENLTYMANMFKGVVSRQGLDYDKDLAPLLTSEHAMSLAYDGGILPNLDFYFDVSDKADQAKAFVDKLHALIDKMLGSYFAKNPQFKQLVLNVKDEKSSGYEYVLAPDVAQIFKDIKGDQLSALKDNDFAFRYGVLDGTLYLQFNLGKRPAIKPLTDDTTFVALKNKLTDYNGAMIYFNPGNFQKMMDDIVGALTANNGNFTEQNMSGYQTLKQVLSHISGLLFGYSDNTSVMGGAGYLLVK